MFFPLSIDLCLVEPYCLKILSAIYISCKTQPGKPYELSIVVIAISDIMNHHTDGFVLDPAFLRSIECLDMSSVVVEFSTASIVSVANDFSSSNTVAHTVSHLNTVFSTFSQLTECCFFKRFTSSLWKEKVYKNNFISKNATVNNEIPPTYISKTNWIGEGSEKLCRACKELENGYTTRPLSVGPDLNKVR